MPLTLLSMPRYRVSRELQRAVSRPQAVMALQVDGLALKIPAEHGLYLWLVVANARTGCDLDRGAHGRGGMPG